MKKIINRIDGVIMIRLLMGMFFLLVGIIYKEWIPAIFGGLWIAVAFTRRGCGYGNCNLQK